MVLLNFEEMPDLIALSDKQVNGKPNFIEVLPPIDIQEVLEVKKKWQDGMLFQSPVIKREPQIKLK